MGLFAHYGGSKAKVAFQDSANDDGNKKTFSGLTFGDAASDRHLIVGVSGVFGSAITGVTIGGVSAERLVRVTSNFGDVRSEFWIAPVPTGETGSVAITSSGGVGASVSVYSATGLKSASARDTNTDNSNTATIFDLDVDVPAGGFALAQFSTSQSSNGNTVWTGVDEDFDGQYGTDFGNGTYLHSGGRYSATSAETRSISCTVKTFTNAACGCSVSLR